MIQLLQQSQVPEEQPEESPELPHAWPEEQAWLPASASTQDSTTADPADMAQLPHTLNGVLRVCQTQLAITKPQALRQ